MDVHLKIKTMPSLCFNKDDFMADDFSVDGFVSECRKYASLETMKEDLDIYHKILCSAMVELINQDYADFVNLSSNLVGLDKSIKNFSMPLQSLKNEVYQIKDSLDETLASAHEKFGNRALNNSAKIVVYHVLSVLEGIQKIELNTTVKTDEESAKLETLERIAFTFNMVQFHHTHMQKMSNLESINCKEEVVMRVAKDLEGELENAFLRSLSGDVDTQKNLHKILMVYSIIGQEKKAEDCFSREVVRPFMKNVLTQSNITRNGLKVLYDDILAFIPKYCSHVLKASRRTHAQKNKKDQAEVVPGFDFVVNSVWPEVMNCFQYIAPVYIYSLGDPQLFHQNYTTSMNFLDKFEHLCEIQGCVKKLREMTSYQDFINKWNLDLYFQIRFQEIAGEFEQSLMVENSVTESDNVGKLPYQLSASCSLWSSLNVSWSNNIFLCPLKNNFLRLTLQLLSRFRNWAYSMLTKTDISCVFIAKLIQDVELLISEIKTFAHGIIYPKLGKGSSHGSIEGAFEETFSSLGKIPPFAGKLAVKLLLEKCCANLKSIANIPQRFRKTNREVPSKPSLYVSEVLSPLTDFLQETNAFLQSPKWTQYYKLQVIDGIVKQCIVQMNDVLNSIRRMEDSLKILKRARDKPSAGYSNNVVTDDDKIRRQLALDVCYFEELILKLGVQSNDLQSLLELKDLVTSAERSPTNS